MRMDLRAAARYSRPDDEKDAPGGPNNEPGSRFELEHFGIELA